MIDLSDKDIKRFWSKVDIKSEDECWIWKAGKGRFNYGSFWLNGKSYSSHRVSYYLHNPEADINLFICHKCDIPECVSPHHLFAGTQNDNMQDKVIKNRQPKLKGSKHGMSILTEEQVLQIKNTDMTFITQEQLAKQYSVSRQIINQILNGRRWKHVVF